MIGDTLPLSKDQQTVVLGGANLLEMYQHDIESAFVSTIFSEQKLRQIHLIV